MIQVSWRKQLPIGWTIISHCLFHLFPLHSKYNKVHLMILLADSSVPLIIIGMWVQETLICFAYSVLNIFRVHANLRDMAPGFNFTSSFFLRCLYENESGDPESPDIGFLKGPFVVCVSDLFHNVYHFIISSGILSLLYISVICWRWEWCLGNNI